MKKFHSSTNKTSLFLIFILTAGTLTAFFLSTSLSMIDAYAIKDVEKDQCNNVNLNLNGLNIDAVPEPLTSLLQGQAEAEDGQLGTSNFVNGKDKFNHDKNFSFFCVNNNDNEFIKQQTPQAPQTPQVPPTEPPCKVTVDTLSGISRPTFFGHDPVNERMYLSTLGQSVSVIDTETNTLIDIDGDTTNGITNITIGGFPSGIAYDSVNERMYVANEGDTSVSVIDTETNTLIDIDGDTTNGITPIPIGFETSAIAYDSFNKRIYVADLDFRVHVIDTENNTLIDTDGDATNGITPIFVGRQPLGIAYDSFNKRMYVANSAFVVNSTLSVIDTTTNTEIDTDGDATNGITRIIVGNDARYLAYDPINKQMYVTNFQADSVNVIDTITNTVVDTIPVGSNPLGITYDPVNHRMYIANFNLFDIEGGSVSIINLCPRP